MSMRTLVSLGLRGRCAAVAAGLAGLALLGAGSVHGQAGLRQPAERAAGSTVRSARPTTPSAQRAASVDVGDSYAGPEGRRHLRRLADAFAVQTTRRDEAARAATVGALTRQGGALAGYRETQRLRSGLVILRAGTPAAPRAELANGTEGAGEARARLQRARRAVRSGLVNPVFIDPRTGLQLLLDRQLVVRLGPEISPAKHFGAQWKNVRPVWGAPDQFVLTLPDGTAENVLAEVDRQAALPGVTWAEPNFMSQAVRTFIPNDPFFGDQWHLRNTGQTGASAGADAHVTGAWDVTTGTSNIVIAIVDDGVQLSHPDLSANIYHNPGEIAANGFDDDHNGIEDDVTGYNFVVGLPDPNPYSVDDNHGTAVAGLAAGVGNNGIGTSGVAPGCRILPVKILEGDYTASASELAKALRYAAGLGSSGQPVWAGADVLNISLVFGQLATTDAALADAAAKGRRGRGCAIMAAAGNYASAWEPVEYVVEEEGTYTLRFEYSKNRADTYSTGADTVWIDSIEFPDGTLETFEGDLGDGWITSTFSAWSIVTDGVGGNVALTGWDGPGSHALRAGRITHGQTNYAQLTTYLTPGRLRFWALVSSEISRDYFDFWVGHNGFESLVFSQSGVPEPELPVSYPASNPSTIAVGASTDFDYRADYSQYGALLDFLAPSDGGLATVTTVDRTGTDGYGNEDYTFDFGGTSASTPITSGVAALVLSANPYITAAEIRALLRSTCDRVGGFAYDANGRNIYCGSGRLNAERALAQSRPNLRVTLSPPTQPVLAGDVMTYAMEIRNIGFARSGVITVTNTLPPGTVFVSSSPLATRSDRLLTFTGPSLAAGATWTIRVTVSAAETGILSLVGGASTDVTETSLAENVASGVVTVSPVPVIWARSVQVAEGNAGKAKVPVEVTLSNPSSRKVTVVAQAMTNTASAGSDFAPLKTTLAFLPGETNKTVLVSVVGDTRNEDDEIVLLALSSPVNAALGTNAAVLTILNDDPLPLLSAADVTRVEGNSGWAKATFKLQLSAPSGRAVSVDYATVAGTAEAGVDFMPTNGIVVIPAGKTTATVTVLVAGDPRLEGNETFALALSHPVNALLAAESVTCTILNNDALPKIYVDDAGLVEGSGGVTNRALVPVRLATPSELPVSVAFTTTNGTALAGQDYVATNGVISFAPGETNQLIAIAVSGDNGAEPLEFFSVRLSSPTNAVLGRSLAKVSITNDDGVASVDLFIHDPARFRVVTLAARRQGAELVLEFFATSDLTYWLESADGFSPDARWQEVPGSLRAGSDGLMTVSVPWDASVVGRFYRLASHPR